MPNWPLSSEIRSHIKERARALGSLVVDLNRLKFPLTAAQIQAGASGLTAKQIALIKQLEHEGLRTIQQVSSARIGFLPEHFPELRRGVIVSVDLKTKIYVRHVNYISSYSRSKDFVPNSDAYLPAILGDLTPDQRAALVTWLDKALRQERIFEIVTGCVGIALHEKTSPTVGHLQHLWPTLGTLIEPRMVSQWDKSAQVRLQTWIERFRNPPRRGTSRYEPDLGSAWVNQKFAQLIKVADTQLSTGRMLGEVKLNDGNTIYPKIENWQRIEGDVTFPLKEPA